ncbi:hypothetical protein HYS96_01100 [Candidatus Daviesbacteria bacterium]|nr:hypothetical protein [Candidatus Daviesbacteria bacterium]
MLKLILKILPALFFGGVFLLAVFQIPYPETLTQANVLQILGFFIPLFLLISFVINIFIKNLFLSISISLGIIFLLLLKALDSLNLVTGGIAAVMIILSISYFRKMKKRSPSINSGFKNLTKLPKIPKLTHVRK